MAGVSYFMLFADMSVIIIAMVGVSYFMLFAGMSIIIIVCVAVFVGLSVLLVGIIYLKR